MWNRLVTGLDGFIVVDRSESSVLDLRLVVAGNTRLIGGRGLVRFCKESFILLRFKDLLYCKLI